jgi:hypothetical protein
MECETKGVLTTETQGHGEQSGIEGHGFGRAFFFYDLRFYGVLSAAFDFTLCIAAAAHSLLTTQERSNSQIKFNSGGQECPPHTRSRNSSHFSYPFHKEVLSSTVSAQVDINLPLRVIPYSRTVLTVQT